MRHFQMCDFAGNACESYLWSLYYIETPCFWRFARVCLKEDFSSTYSKYYTGTRVPLLVMLVVPG